MSYTRALIQRSSKNWRGFSPPRCPTSILSPTLTLFSTSRAKDLPSRATGACSAIVHGVPDELSTGDTGVAPKTPLRPPHTTRSRSFSSSCARSWKSLSPEVDAGEPQTPPPPQRLFPHEHLSQTHWRPPSAPTYSREIPQATKHFVNDGHGMQLINRYARVPNVFSMIGNFSNALPPQPPGRQHEKQPPPSAHQDSSPDHHTHALELEEKEPIGAYAGDAAAAATAEVREERAVESDAPTFPVPPAPPIPPVTPAHPRPSTSPPTSTNQPQTTFSSAAPLTRLAYPWQVETTRKDEVEEVSSGWSLRSVISHMRGYLHRKRSCEDNGPPQTDGFSPISSVKMRRMENKSCVYDAVTSSVGVAENKLSSSEAKSSFDTTQPSAKMEVEPDAMYSSWEDPLLKIQEQLLRHRPADEMPQVHRRRRQMTHDGRQLGKYAFGRGTDGGQGCSYSTSNNNNNNFYDVAPTPPPPPPPPSPPPPPPPPRSQFPVTGYASPRTHFEYSSNALGAMERQSQDDAVVTSLPAAQRSYVSASFGVYAPREDTPFGSHDSCGVESVTRREEAAPTYVRKRQSVPMRCSSSSLAMSSGARGRVRTMRRERKCLGHDGTARTDLVTFFSMAAAVHKQVDNASTLPTDYFQRNHFATEEEKEGYSPYASYAIRSSVQSLHKTRSVPARGGFRLGWSIDDSVESPPPPSPRPAPRDPTAAVSAPGVSVEMGGTRFAYTKAETYAFAHSPHDGSVFATAASETRTFARSRSTTAAMDGRAALVAFAERLSRASVESGTIDPSDPANPCNHPQSSHWNHLEAGRVI